MGKNKIHQYVGLVFCFLFRERLRAVVEAVAKKITLNLSRLATG